VYELQAHRYSWVENWSEEHQRPFYYNQVITVLALSAQLLPKKPQKAPTASLLQCAPATACARVRQLLVLALNGDDWCMHAENEGVQVGEANRSGLAARAHVKRFSRALRQHRAGRSR
jgi:hypothetical protein